MQKRNKQVNSCSNLNNDATEYVRKSSVRRLPAAQKLIVKPTVRKHIEAGKRKDRKLSRPSMSHKQAIHELKKQASKYHKTDSNLMLEVSSSPSQHDDEQDHVLNTAKRSDHSFLTKTIKEDSSEKCNRIPLAIHSAVRRGNRPITNVKIKNIPKGKRAQDLCNNRSVSNSSPQSLHKRNVTGIKSFKQFIPVNRSGERRSTADRIEGNKLFDSFEAARVSPAESTTLPIKRTDFAKDVQEEIPLRSKDYHIKSHQLQLGQQRSLQSRRRLEIEDRKTKRMIESGLKLIPSHAVKDFSHLQSQKPSLPKITEGEIQKSMGLRMVDEAVGIQDESDFFQNNFIVNNEDQIEASALQDEDEDTFSYPSIATETTSTEIEGQDAATMIANSSEILKENLSNQNVILEEQKQLAQKILRIESVIGNAPDYQGKAVQPRMSILETVQHIVGCV